MKILSNMTEIESIEIVSPRVSAQYVPIFTSEVVKTLQPEFELIGGTQITKGSSKHYVDLRCDADTLRIYNSYDRTMAFSLSLMTDGLAVNLDIDRLIHRGSNAKEFNETFKTKRDEIFKSIESAKILTHNLANTKISKSLAKKISDKIFINKYSVPKDYSYKNYVDLLIGKISISQYIIHSINKFIDGDYTFTTAGVKKNGIKTRSILRRVEIENEIIQIIVEDYPELML